MKFEDVIRLAFSQSLILGHCPDKITLGQVGNKVAASDLDIGKFGLFDTASPNYSTYYPEVTAEDLKPKDDEFIYPVFRLLSEVIVHKSWNPIDFAKNGVLRESLRMLVGQTINIDHETAIGNAVGAVQSTEWQESYLAKGGVKVPAGINGRFKIDGKSNPRIARGILMDPPSIHSNSVTVAFEWEKSHPNMPDNEFYSGLGKYGPDKELIRRVVTKVRDYRETSLVGAGADPFARIIKDGEILDPRKSSRAYNSASGFKIQSNLFLFSYKNDVISNSQTEEDVETIPDPSNNNKPEIAMQKTIAILASLLGLTTEQLQASDDAASISLNQVVAELNNLRALKGTQEAELARLNGLITPLQKFKNDQMKLAIDEVKRLYVLTNPTGDNSVMMAAIDKYDFETAQASIKNLTALADEKFPVTCKDCGGHDVSRASSKVGSENPNENGPKTHEQVMEELTATNYDVSAIHGKTAE